MCNVADDGKNAISNGRINVASLVIGSGKEPPPVLELTITNRSWATF